MYGGAEWSTTMSSETSTAPRSSSTAWAGTRVLARAATRGGTRAVTRATRQGGSKGSFNDFKGVGKGDKSREMAKEKVARAAALTGIATGVESGATLNRVVVRRTTTWRTNGRTGRATLRVVTRSPTTSKRTRTSWRIWRNLGAIAACSPWNIVAVAVLLRTGFADLQELNEDEEMSVGTGTPTGLTVGDFITVKPKYQKKTKDRKVNQQTCFGDLNNVEVNTVHEKSDANELTITIDSGASENVISEEFAPQVKVRACQGSWEGVRCVTANGGTMSNRGEKHIHVLTTDGEKCMLNMQVTDVKKPLISVAPHLRCWARGGFPEWWRLHQAHGERTDHEVQPGG